ncbi:MAG: aminotransferase class V-fold PLP-dependent enzyme [Frankiaceae bacterium]
MPRRAERILPADPARTWVDARAPARVRHFDAAACGRPSATVLAAHTRQLHAEAEYGGYVAEEQAEPLVCAGRAALARMIDPDALTGADVALFGSATSAFATLLDAWRLPPGASIGVVAFEYARSAALLSARATRDGLRLVRLPVDATGRLDLARLDRHGPDLADLELVTLPHVASHRGVVQPVGALAARCTAADTGMIVDAAQSLGQVELAAHAAGSGDGPGVRGTVWVGTSRKWLCGPRGVGFAAIGPDVADRLHLDAPALAAARGPAAGLFGAEAAIAARVGWALGVLELEAAGPAVLARLVAERALAVRRRLAQVPGWRVREPADDASYQADDGFYRRNDSMYRPGGILTLEPEDGRDPTAVRARLLADGVLTGAVPAERAPWEALPAALRVSVHAWTTDDDADALADALAAAVPRG